MVNCTCGNNKVSKDYGLFVTYPLQPGEDFQSLTKESGVPTTLLERFNLTSYFSGGSRLLFVPPKDGVSSYSVGQKRKRSESLRWRQRSWLLVILSRIRKDHMRMWDLAVCTMKAAGNATISRAEFC